ncbi:MAG: 30S ribosomal protein S8 [Planctomycetes bacterium]|nr:30S ribosomal protein S8 [Planctomycetota bacterium]
MWSDPVADMLTRIRNAVRMHAREVRVPASSLKAGIAKVLQEEGYILGFDRIQDTRQGLLRIHLKYDPTGAAVIREIKRESKAGRRVYRAVDELPRVMNGLGIAILSTNRGVLSDRQCKEMKVGGELLCTVC